jgi:chromosome segregation ATPase
MEPPDPGTHQSIEMQSAKQGNELDVSQGQSAPISPPDGHWLRMDPSLASAVLAKTEEELLGSLAALMRNKVEHEQARRRFAQVQIETEQAKRELEAVKQQLRHAEEEVTTRLNEQSRISEELGRLHREVAPLREEHQQHFQTVSDLKNELTLGQQSLAEAHGNLGKAKEAAAAAEAELAAHREAIAQLAHLKDEKTVLEESLGPLRAEIDERIKAREALVAEAVVLHQQVSDLATQQAHHAAEVTNLKTSHAELGSQLDGLRAEHLSLVSQMEDLRPQVAQHASEKEKLQADLADLQNEIARAAAERQSLQSSLDEEKSQINELAARKEALKRAVAETVSRQGMLQTEIAAAEGRLHELTEAAEKAEQARMAEGLPLLFESEVPRIAPDWNSYLLESEFHSDESLDAGKVAQLVSSLPGLEGCLIVKNHGAVLASQLPERIHGLLKVPNRNYQLLFERLENKVEEYNLPKARLATFDLGGEALTVAQANHMFLVVNHRQNKLRPGMGAKLASIVSEVSKMYP